MSLDQPGLLVIDDEPAILTLTRRVFDSTDLAFFGADTGAEGIAIFEASADSIDVVLLDMSLPDMEGGDVFEALRARGETVPILLTSGYPAETFEHLLGLPGVRFIKKPFMPTELIDEVNEVLVSCLRNK